MGVWLDAHRRSGRLSGERAEADRRRNREPLRGNRVVAPMAVTPARRALLLDVGNLATRGHFAIATDDAPAAESREAKKPDETHDALHFDIRAIRMPPTSALMM
jgi:hypothetical protein